MNLNQKHVNSRYSNIILVRFRFFIGPSADACVLVRTHLWNRSSGQRVQCLGRQILRWECRRCLKVRSLPAGCLLIIMSFCSPNSTGKRRCYSSPGYRGVTTPRCLGRSFPCHANENSRSAFISCCRRKACFRFSGIKGVVQGC